MPFGGSSHEPEGYLHGGTPASVIFSDGAPGSGPRLHRHPCAEVFIMLEVRATFTAGEETVEARGGQVLVAPAGLAQRFVNGGDGPLRRIDIHLNDRFVTEWRDD